MKASERLIVPLDVPNLNIACKLVKMLDTVSTFKIGSQLFVNSGPESVKALQMMGKNVFLDLKFHDIPNTVAKAAEAVTEMSVDLFTVHVSSGLETMQAAVESSKRKAAELGIQQPLIIGVTLLTSVDEATFQRDFGSQRELSEQVRYMTKLAQQAGLDGVVASAHEASMVRSLCGDEFIIVTPGIRPAGKAKGKRRKAEDEGQKAKGERRRTELEKLAVDDQRRVMTPSEAIKAGATYLVVGRPIYKAADPKQAVEEIVREIENISV